MVLLIIDSLLSLISSGLLFYFLRWYEQPFLAFWLLLMIPALTLAFFLLFAFSMFVETRFVKLGKEVHKVNRPILWCLHQTAFWVTHFCGLRIHVNGKELLSKEPRFLLVSNHQSGFDHLVFFTIWPHLDLVSITKPENEKMFVAGRIMHQAGFIPIDRDDAMKALKSIVLAIRYIKEDQASIAIAPEGTRSHDGSVHEFHPGSFKIATKAECPLALVSIQNTDRVKGRFPWRRTDVYVNVIEVEPFSQYGCKNTVDLANYAQKTITDDLANHQNLRL